MNVPVNRSPPSDLSHTLHLLKSDPQSLLRLMNTDLIVQLAVTSAAIHANRSAPSGSVKLTLGVRWLAGARS